MNIICTAENLSRIRELASGFGVSEVIIVPDKSSI